MKLSERVGELMSRGLSEDRARELASCLYHSEYIRKRYKNDPEFRSRQKRYAKMRYRRLKRARIIPRVETTKSFKSENEKESLRISK